VLSLTEVLREELAGTGFPVTCLELGATKTGFDEDSRMGKLDMFSSHAMTAAAVAIAGYEGYGKNQDVGIPGWKNRLLVTAIRLLPRFTNREIVGKMQRV